MGRIQDSEGFPDSSCADDPGAYRADLDLRARATAQTGQEAVGGKPNGKHRSGKRDGSAVRAARARAIREDNVRRALANMLRLSIAEHNRGKPRGK